VRAHIHTTKLDEINQVFQALEAGKVDGRMVLTL
jgi:D-arabinose 1-dehydrogenase-like Zn-dependent alcohol dehydrogenase